VRNHEKRKKSVSQGIQHLDVAADGPQRSRRDSHLTLILVPGGRSGVFDAEDVGVQHRPVLLPDDVERNDEVVDVVVLQGAVQRFPDREYRPVRADA